MNQDQLVKLLRKYWYVALILIALVGALVYLVAGSGKDPMQLLGEYGYLVILVWTFLEGETIVIIAGATSAAVGLEPWLIAVSAFCGSFLSDQVMFSLGKYKGEDVLGYFPRIAKNVDKAAGLFKKYDTALILGFRFVYGVRNVTPILLGISGVSHKKFFFLNFIGAGVWAATFTYGGLLAGEAFRTAMEHLGHGIFYVLLALLAGGGLLWYFRARRNVRHASTISKRCQDEAAQGEPLSAECSVDAAAAREAASPDAPMGEAGSGQSTGADADNPEGDVPSAKE